MRSATGQKRAARSVSRQPVVPTLRKVVSPPTVEASPQKVAEVAEASSYCLPDPFAYCAHPHLNLDPFTPQNIGRVV